MASTLLETQEAKTGTARILVAEDDPTVISLYCDVLDLEGYEVVTALKEEDALTAVREQAFDLSIIDLQLAKRNGISVMEDVHKITPDIPVIILTAYGSIESAVEAIQKGAYDYMTKPFDSKELLSKIKTALERSRRSH